MARTSVITIIAGSVLFLYKDEIKKTANEYWDNLIDSLYCCVVIGKDDHKCRYVVKRILEDNNQFRCIRAIDGHDVPDFTVPNGSYIVEHIGEIRQGLLLGRDQVQPGRANINIEITDDNITLSSLWFRIEELKQYMVENYQKYCSPELITTFYLSVDDTWGLPQLRRPRNPINLTPDMVTALSDIENFILSENEYKNKGYPFRKGYMLTGPQGTGKSAISEIIASRHNMDIYLININAHNMDDAKLIRLMSSTRPNSIIMLDEFEKQLEALGANPANLVTYSGILSSIDGPQRLAHNTIIILTSNSLENIDPIFKEKLLRPGRIDTLYEFRTQFT